MPETNKKLWLKTVTPEQLAEIKVGDWLEGFGDILSLVEETLVRRFGQLFQAKIEQQRKCIRGFMNAWIQDAPRSMYQLKTDMDKAFAKAEEILNG